MQEPRDSQRQVITEDCVQFTELAIWQMAHCGVFVERSVDLSVTWVWDALHLDSLNQMLSFKHIEHQTG